MAYYLVRAKPEGNPLEALKSQLDRGEIRVMRPFGTALDYSLSHARLDADGSVVWEEEDYCSPPLAQERVVLDRYFTNLDVERVEQGQGWAQIDELPRLWDE